MLPKMSLLMPTLVALLCMFSTVTIARPYFPFASDLQSRADPVFPDQPPSCPICSENYGSISSCAQAAPVLANVSEILFNPGAFIDVIKCACTDTFQSVYPQCVDCFEKTNQTNFLNSQDLPAVVSGIRSICAIASTLVGNVSGADNETTPTAGVAPTPTAADSAAHLLAIVSPSTLLFGITLILGIHVWV